MRKGIMQCRLETESCPEQKHQKIYRTRRTSSNAISSPYHRARWIFGPLPNAIGGTRNTHQGSSFLASYHSCIATRRQIPRGVLQAPLNILVCFVLVRLIYATRIVLLTGLYLPDMETLWRLTALRTVPGIPSVLVDQGLV